MLASMIGNLKCTVEIMCLLRNINDGPTVIYKRHGNIAPKFIMLS